MKKKILFVIPDGVGIRNYLFSDLLKILQKQNWEIGFLHALSPQAIEEIKKVHPGLAFREFSFHPYKETLFNRFLRESVSYGRLIHNARITGNPTILSNWHRPAAFKKKLFYILVEKYGKWLSGDYNRILRAEKYYEERLQKLSNPYDELIKNYRPDVVFNLHQRALQAVPPVLAAIKQKIPAVEIIYSWDNLPKARLTVRTDDYLVWSKYMKDEMRLYYPEINGENIHITGTPQFEFYYKPELIWDKKDFYARHQIPLDKKIVVYSGGDTRTSPYDQLYVDEIARQLSRMPENERPVLLVRPTPADPADRYEEVVKKWPGIIRLSLPAWHRDKHWSLSFPTFADVELLVNTVVHSEAVINVGSTMALDFATHEKPAVYINFNIKKEGPWDIKRVNRFQHFRTMDGLDPVFYWDQPDQLPDLLKRIFQGEKKPDAVKWLYRINNYPKDASERIARYLMQKTD